MMADIESNKKLSPVVTELFLWQRKLDISLVFILQNYFKIPKTIRLKKTHYFIMNIPNKRELEIDFKDFMKFYKDYTKRTIFIFSEPYDFIIR